jgi:hypothetical protein
LKETFDYNAAWMAGVRRIPASLVSPKSGGAPIIEPDCSAHVAFGGTQPVNFTVTRISVPLPG